MRAMGTRTDSWIQSRIWTQSVAASNRVLTALAVGSAWVIDALGGWNQYRSV